MELVTQLLSSTIWSREVKPFSNVISSALKGLRKVSKQSSESQVPVYSSSVNILYFLTFLNPVVLLLGAGHQAPPPKDLLFTELATFWRHQGLLLMPRKRGPCIASETAKRRANLSCDILLSCPHETSLLSLSRPWAGDHLSLPLQI